MNAAAAQLFKRLKLIDEQEVGRLVEKHLREYDPALHSLATIHKEMETVLNRDDISPEEKLSLFKINQQRFGRIKIPPVDATPDPIIPPEIPIAPIPPPLTPAPAPPRAPPLPPHPGRVIPIPRNQQPAKQPKAPQGNANMAVKPIDDAGVPAPILMGPAGDQPFGEQDERAGGPEREERGFIPRQFVPAISDSHRPKLYHLIELIEENPHFIKADHRTGELILQGKNVPGSSFKDVVESLYRTSKMHNLKGQADFLGCLRKSLNQPEWRVNLKAENLISNKKQLKIFNKRGVEFDD